MVPDPDMTKHGIAVARNYIVHRIQLKQLDQPWM